MADWQEIKNEFITKRTSFRKLAEKYGLNKDTIWKKAKDEDWDRQRRQHLDNVQTELLSSDIEQKVSGAKKLNEAAEMLLNIAVEQMRTRNPMEMSTQEMKHISGVLRDVKETLMIKSDADRREQEARIANLRKQAEKEEQNHDVTITIAGGDPSWQS
jgi:hypothetical protein